MKCVVCVDDGERLLTCERVCVCLCLGVCLGIQADGKLMGHILPGILLFGLSALWFAELMMRRRRNAIGIGRPSAAAAAAAAHVHMPLASYSSLECLGKLIFPAIGIFTELRSAARYHLPTGILPAFRNHAGEIICEDSGDRECREFSTTLQVRVHRHSNTYMMREREREREMKHPSLSFCLCVCVYVYV